MKPTKHFIFLIKIPPIFYYKFTLRISSKRILSLITIFFTSFITNSTAEETYTNEYFQSTGFEKSTVCEKRVQNSVNEYSWSP